MEIKIELTRSEKQEQIIHELLELQYQESDAFMDAYQAFLDNDEDFTFEECEQISMEHGWA